MAALTRRGLSVQPFKVGPDYIDPAFHSFVTGHQSRNLDSWILSESMIRSLFFLNAPSAGDGISIIEGVMGLFDGHVQSGTGSSAHVAQILSAPTILVVNGAAMSRSIAALVHGYDDFLPNFKLSGVIINKVKGHSHYNLVRDFVEREAGVKCYGYLAQNMDMALESRHLGLVPSIEVDGLSTRLSLLAKAVEETLDLDGLINLAESAPDLDPPSAVEIKTTPSRVRIGLASDSAFNFYYQDGLDLLTSLGADLVPFSPIADKCLPPDLDGLYIGGGFPEIFAAELMANEPLRAEIRETLEQGLPAYAECGGLMYLSQRLTDLEGHKHWMVGFFPQETIMTKRLQNFGYVEVGFERDTVLGPAGSSIRAHEFHHSIIEGPDPDFALNIHKSKNRSWKGGLVKNNVLAAYPHLHFFANPSLAVNFVSACRNHAESRKTSG